MIASAVLSRKCLRTYRQFSAWKNTPSASVALRRPFARDSSMPSVRSAKTANCCAGMPADAAKNVWSDILLCMVCLMRIVFDPGHVARGVFKVMHFPVIALLDDFLPSSREQLAQILTNSGVAHRIFDRATGGWHPARGNSARSVDIWIQVQRHCTPCLKLFALLQYRAFAFPKHLTID